MKVSVVGLGKLGSCLMAVLASEHEVIGVDLNARLVHDINRQKAPFVEPGLQDLLVANEGHYRATTDTFEVAETDLTFVVVPTPSGEDGRFSNQFIFQAIDMIGAAIQEKPGPHIVCITSTVMPSSTRGPIRERLERASGRSDIALAYSPEFIALGSVIHDMQHPDMLLIGSEDGWVQATIAKVLDPHDLVPVARVSTMEAEIAKLAINAYVTTKISFANTIGEMCDSLEGVDPRKITAAIGLDSRIGPKYLTPATAFGGPCFPRDNEAFIAFAGVAPISKATVEVNDRQVKRTMMRLNHIAPDTNGVTILGMAYKPDTPIIERSFGMALAEALKDWYTITVYDPLAMEAVQEELGSTIKYADSAQQAVDSNRVIVIAQPCDEFRNLKFGNRKVLDLWGIT